MIRKKSHAHAKTEKYMKKQVVKRENITRPEKIRRKACQKADLKKRGVT